MGTFILTIEASVSAAGGAAPSLDILVDGVPVTSSAGITAVTGVGSDLLVFTLEFSGTYPTSLSFRFNGGSGDPGDIISLDTVRINGQALSGGDLSAILLAQGATASVNSTAAHDHLFGLTEPAPADLGTVTHNGTAGADAALLGSSGADVIDGGAGDDYIRGLESDDGVIGGDGADQIYGEGGNDIILGGIGNDKIFGGIGDDLIYGQDDDDTISGDEGNDVLNGGAGNDVLIGQSGNDILIGGTGNDRLIGTSGSNTLYGDAGLDVMIGGLNNDIMYGGTEDDQMHGAAGNDEMYGEGGNDVMTGGGGNDTLDGGAGNDSVYGYAGTDTLVSGAGNDLFDGGAGTDTMTYANAAASVTASLFAGAASNDGDGGSDMLTGIENLTGSAFGDTLTGDTGANVLTGGNGNDTLAGHGGADTLDGGAGTDTASYATAISAVTASLLAGSASSDGDGGTDTFTSIENLTGSAYNDTLTGDANANALTGNGGNDTLNGGGGVDTLDGNAGNDTLNGDAGNDTISGGVGDDTLNGGADNDTLYALDNGISATDADDGTQNILNGDAGSDTLYGSTGMDVLNGGDDADTIYSGASSAIVTLLSSGFDADSEDFAYSDGGFGGTDPASFADVNGTYITTDGDTANGALQVYVDQTANNKSFSNASGTWGTSVTNGTDYLTDVQITFSYRHVHDAANDAGENSQVWFEFDGATYDASGGNSYISQLVGGGASDTGWIQVTINLPDLAAGATYDLAMGILHLGSNRTDEDAYVMIDDVTLTGSLGILTTLNGEGGADNLYGSNGGKDVFMFESASAFTGVDQIYNFSIADTDAINLLEVLNGLYIEGTHNVTNFVQITDSGANSVVRVDLTGTANFGAGTQIATIIGVTGLTDEQALLDDGNLIMPTVPLDIIGTPAPDTLNGTAASEAIGGLASNDLLYGAGGNDTLYGFEGSDTAYYASAAGAVTASLATATASNDGDGGTDTFNSIENITGSAFGDNLTGDDFANILTGLGGNDTLSGGGGNDTLVGGAGNDTLTGGIGTDTADYTSAAGAVTASLLAGSAANDGNGSTDTLATIENISGSVYGDNLTGDSNANILEGLAGNDTLTGHGGTDTLNGGADTDTVSYASAAAGVIADLSGGAASDDGDGAADTLISIENITGSANDDTLFGDANNNTLSGGNGNDTLGGRGGADTLNGGGGTDTVTYLLAASGVTASLATGTATVDGDGATDSFVSIENLTGSDYNDSLTGDGNANTLIGGIGSDTLTGGAGNDNLYALGSGVSVPVTAVNQDFAAGLGTFAFTGSGIYFRNDLSTNDNNGNNSAHMNLGRDGGNPSNTYTNISGTFSTTITFTQDTDNVELSLFYNIIATALDAGETPVMNILWNGVNVFSDSVIPNGGTVDSGWLSTGTISIGSVAAGSYTLQLQGFLGSSNRSEDGDFYFDQVLVTGTQGSNTGDAGYTNTLRGGAGLDNLYGGDGEDIFVFENASAFANIDTVNVFTLADGDALDISNILSAAGYDPLSDAITDFVEITDSGANSVVRVDVTGTANFGAGTQIATIVGTTGLTDEAALVTSGNLIT